MFPLPIITYVKIATGVICVLGIFYAGWHIRDVDYMAFKAQVKAESEKQEAHVESIKKQQDLVTKGIQNEYDAKLTAIRNYYKSTSVWNNGSGSQMSGISTAPSVTDVISSYNQLASSCAETTQQLVSLQEWLNQQIGIK
ncbi:hypothetical protein UFOVP146_20 [uncultured Caudovirales phage]|jgi:hypothetical protein|uniref:Uncharacterized protein n=1 Tax=uncultured Caudovirales phage TaxID=2100421 RepID=A0A6J7VKA7_9CAUD|nr:hypothetical protein UFOVP146_20 [uncultured Caudovirales phage]